MDIRQLILLIRRSVAEVSDEDRLHINKDAKYEWEFKNAEWEARARLMTDEHAKHIEF
jgi:hypothetical protein